MGLNFKFKEKFPEDDPFMGPPEPELRVHTDNVALIRHDMSIPNDNDYSDENDYRPGVR